MQKTTGWSAGHFVNRLHSEARGGSWVPRFLDPRVVVVGIAAVHPADALQREDRPGERDDRIAIVVKEECGDGAAARR